MLRLKYLNTNIEAKEGDIVRIAQGEGRYSECKILKVIVPNTVDAVEWSAPNGGVLIEGENYGLCLWNYLDEDIDFISRKPQ